MDIPPVVLGLNWVLGITFVVMIAHSVWDIVRILRAERRIVQILSERDEYRPLLYALLSRAREHDGELPLTEHEEIDLRDQVRRALVHVPPTDRKRVEGGLFGHTVSGRRAYLRRVLYASMRRLQQQAA